MTSTTSSPIDPAAGPQAFPADHEPASLDDLVCAGCDQRLADRVSRRLSGLVAETLCSRCSRPSYLGTGRARR